MPKAATIDENPFPQAEEAKIGSMTDGILAAEAYRAEVAAEENPEDEPILMRKSLVSINK